MENMDDLLKAAEAMKPTRREFPKGKGEVDEPKLFKLGFGVHELDGSDGICLLTLMHEDGGEDGEIPIALFLSRDEAELFTAALDIIAHSHVVGIETSDGGE